MNIPEIRRWVLTSCQVLVKTLMPISEKEITYVIINTLLHSDVLEMNNHSLYISDKILLFSIALINNSCTFQINASWSTTRDENTRNYI